MKSSSIRITLYNRAGATCYRDLLTVDNVEHPTFHAAAIAMGLMDDEAELDKVMDEAVTIQSGENVRKLFLSILLYCHPSDPPKYWHSHKEKLYEDWLRDYSVESAEKRPFSGWRNIFCLWKWTFPHIVFLFLVPAPYLQARSLQSLQRNAITTLARKKNKM